MCGCPIARLTNIHIRVIITKIHLKYIKHDEKKKLDLMALNLFYLQFGYVS